MPAKEKPKKARVSVTVIAAIISGIAVIVAAIISIIPNSIDSAIKNVATGTPVTLTKYEDPLGLFSIEYPLGYFIEERILTDEELYAYFCGCYKQQDGNRVGVDGHITVVMGIKKDEFVDISKEYDRVIETVIGNTYSEVSTDTKLMSSKKVDYGYILYVQMDENNGLQSRLWDVFIFAQYKGVTFGNQTTAYSLVTFYIDHDEAGNHNALAEDIFSRFEWSPTKIVENFD